MIKYHSSRLFELGWGKKRRNRRANISAHKIIAKSMSASMWRASPLLSLSSLYLSIRIIAADLSPDRVIRPANSLKAFTSNYCHLYILSAILFPRTSWLLFLLLFFLDSAPYQTTRAGALSIFLLFSLISLFFCIIFFFFFFLSLPFGAHRKMRNATVEACITWNQRGTRRSARWRWSGGIGPISVLIYGRACWAGLRCVSYIYMYV